jgi:integrase
MLGCFLASSSGRRKPRGRMRDAMLRIALLRIGLDVGRRSNHGWGHLFRTLATEAGVSSNVLSAIQGHSPGSVGESYGEVSLIAKDRTIHRVPLPGLWPAD